MSLQKTGFATVCLAALALAGAAGAAEVKFTSAADALKGAGKMVQPEPSFGYIEVVRDKDGEIEVHDAWNDVIVVQEGRGAMKIGSAAAGGRVIAPGEHRGGTMTTTRTQALAPGDILFIPAGLPHQAVLAPGVKSLRYFTVKTKP